MAATHANTMAVEIKNDATWLTNHPQALTYDQHVKGKNQNEKHVKIILITIILQKLLIILAYLIL